MMNKKGKGGMYDDSAVANSGVYKALERNPNAKKSLNEAPCGPYSHMMAEDGMVGYEGDTTVKTGRGTFNFK